MSIIKNRLSRNFTTLPNAIITEKISANAFRIYCYLISKPDGWTVLNNDIKLQLDIKHDRSIAKCWKELITTGWVTRQKMVNDEGKFSGGYDYQLNEIAILPDEQNILIGKKCLLVKNANQQKMAKHINTDLINKTNNINKIYLLWEKLQNKQFDKTTEQYKARISTIDRALKKYNAETISNVIEYKLTSPNTKSKELSSMLGNYLDVNIQNMFIWLENNKKHIIYEKYTQPKTKAQITRDQLFNLDKNYEGEF